MLSVYDTPMIVDSTVFRRRLLTQTMLDFSLGQPKQAFRYDEMML